MRVPFVLGAVALVLLAAGCGQGGTAAEQGRPGPSGFPVPRYVSLRFDRVNARAGPTEEHPVVWTYRTRGLPVQVIAETVDWRRVCDPDGGVAWVHKRVTDGRRTALRREPDQLPLLQRPQPGAPVAAVLNGRSVAPLDRCEGGWCRLQAGRTTGWAPTTAVWGGAEGVQCRMPDQTRETPAPPTRAR